MTNEQSTVAAASLKRTIRVPRIPIRFTALPTGTRLRQYIVQEAIGAGGFGITYRAEHVTLRDKSFALKEFFPRDFAYREGLAVHPAHGGEELCDFGRKRFLQEAKILARCEHGAIVDVVDYFEANSTAYAALEFVQGMPLAQWLDHLRRRPTQAELDSLLGPLLDALEVVHKHRLLHRDIAPDNVLIRPDGSPCLIDFGAARFDMGQKAERTATIVKQGYSPPEQHLGDAEKQGRWTDIYALGATLYRAITGAAPPGAMQRVANRAPMPPLPGNVRDEYRPQFLHAIDMALQLDIERRPQSVPQLRAMLMGALDQIGARAEVTASTATPPATVAIGPLPEPSETRGETEITEIAPASLRRSRHWTAVLATAGLAGGIAAAWAFGAFGIRTGTSPPEGPPPTAPPAVSSQRQVGDAPSAESATSTVSTLPISVSPPSIDRSPAGTANATGQRSDALSSSEPGSPPGAQSPPDLSRDLPANARPIATGAADGATEGAPGLPPSSPSAPATAPTTTSDTELVRLQASCRNGAANAKLAACMALLLTIPTNDTRARYGAQVELGRAHRQRRDPDEAIRAHSEAIRQLPRESEAYNQRGIAKIDKRDFLGALADFRAAVERNPDHGEALNNRAWVQLRLDQPAEGLPDADAAVRLLPDRPFVWDTRGQIHRRLGNRNEAIRDFSEAVRLDPNHRPSQQALNELRIRR